MTRDRPFDAVIFDMDGVLTRTATLHERAWKEIFDALLRTYPDQRPFSSADYRAHVDGKPRYQGVADFLASRQIVLPHGDPGDGPDQPTICGLGNRKNRRLLELLAREGVEKFDDAVAALARWKRGGLRVAAVSASKNCRSVLEAAQLVRSFDAIVDGTLELPGKPELMREAARRLAVPPEDAVVLEDATAGVRAARQDGFGHVVGVARTENDRDLREAGADAVTRNVFRVRFPRRLPYLLDRMRELAAWRGDRPLAVFLDYDGTLAPIVGHPRDAWMPEDTRVALAELARHCPVAILSGRDRADIEQRVGIAGLFYAGNHGFDIAGRGQHRVLPEAEAALAEVERVERELSQHLGHLAGVIIERKRYSVAVHYRLVESEAVVAEVARAVETMRATTGLRLRAGKKVFELEPAVDWDKGRALRWLADVLEAEIRARAFVIYIGDDETDEDAFAGLAGDGAGVRVGEPISTTLADYYIEDPAAVRGLLQQLAGSLHLELPDQRPRPDGREEVGDAARPRVDVEDAQRP